MQFLSARKDPYKNYRFRVDIDEIQAGFSSVTMPEVKAEVIEYREGSDLKSGVRKLPGRIEYENIKLKWGITSSLDLYNWWKTVREGSLKRRDMSITLLDDNGNEACRWNVVNAWPVAYKPGPLEATGNDVLIELLEIAHEGFERVL